MNKTDDSLQNNLVSVSYCLLLSHVRSLIIAHSFADYRTFVYKLYHARSQIIARLFADYRTFVRKISPVRSQIIAQLFADYRTPVYPIFHVCSQIIAHWFADFRTIAYTISSDRSQIIARWFADYRTSSTNSSPADSSATERGGPVKPVLNKVASLPPVLQKSSLTPWCNRDYPLHLPVITVFNFRSQNALKDRQTPSWAQTGHIYALYG